MFRRLMGRSVAAPVPTAVRGAVEEQLRAFARAYDDAMNGINSAMGSLFSFGNMADRGEKELRQVEVARGRAMLSLDEIERLWPEGKSALIELSSAANILADLCKYARTTLRHADNARSARAIQAPYDADNVMLDAILVKQHQRMLKAEQQLLRAGLDFASIVGPDVAYELGLRTSASGQK